MLKRDRYNGSFSGNSSTYPESFHDCARERTVKDLIRLRVMKSKVSRAAPKGRVAVRGQGRRHESVGADCFCVCTMYLRFLPPLPSSPATAFVFLTGLQLALGRGLSDGTGRTFPPLSSSSSDALAICMRSRVCIILLWIIPFRVLPLRLSMLTCICCVPFRVKKKGGGCGWRVLTARILSSCGGRSYEIVYSNFS